MWVVAAAAVIQAGCGGNPYDTVPVSGRVTFDGREPAAECELYFVPSMAQEAQPQRFRPRPAVALSSLDGAFVVSSFKEGDGLLPGTYEVRVECWKTRPKESEDGKPAVKGVSHVPAGFTPPTLTVDPAQAAIRYDLEVPASVSPARKDGRG